LEPYATTVRGKTLLTHAFGKNPDWGRIATLLRAGGKKPGGSVQIWHSSGLKYERGRLLEAWQHRSHCIEQRPAAHFAFIRRPSNGSAADDRDVISFDGQDLILKWVAP
jgi:hypothetical protein